MNTGRFVCVEAMVLRFGQLRGGNVYRSRYGQEMELIRRHPKYGQAMLIERAAECSCDLTEKLENSGAGLYAEDECTGRDLCVYDLQGNPLNMAARLAGQILHVEIDEDLLNPPLKPDGFDGAADLRPASAGSEDPLESLTAGGHAQ